MKEDANAVRVHLKDGTMVGWYLGLYPKRLARTAFVTLPGNPSQRMASVLGDILGPHDRPGAIARSLYGPGLMVSVGMRELAMETVEDLRETRSFKEPPPGYATMAHDPASRRTIYRWPVLSVDLDTFEAIFDHDDFVPA